MAVYVQKSLRKRVPKNPNAALCPVCSSPVQKIGQQDDRAEFNCNRCQRDFTMTNPPKGARRPPRHDGPILIRDRSNEHKKNTSERLGDTPPPKQTKKENVKENTTQEKGDEENSVHTVQQAMEKHNVLSFQYTDIGGETTFRNVEPYKLMKNARGDIILYAFCLDKEGIRAFKLNGVDVLEAQSYTYEPRWLVEDQLDSNS